MILRDTSTIETHSLVDRVNLYALLKILIGTTAIGPRLDRCC